MFPRVDLFVGRFGIQGVSLSDILTEFCGDSLASRKLHCKYLKSSSHKFDLNYDSESCSTHISIESLLENSNDYIVVGYPELYLRANGVIDPEVRLPNDAREILSLVSKNGKTGCFTAKLSDGKKSTNVFSAIDRLEYENLICRKMGSITVQSTKKDKEGVDKVVNTKCRTGLIQLPEQSRHNTDLDFIHELSDTSKRFAIDVALQATVDLLDQSSTRPMDVSQLSYVLCKPSRDLDTVKHAIGRFSTQCGIFPIQEARVHAVEETKTSKFGPKKYAMSKSSSDQYSSLHMVANWPKYVSCELYDTTTLVSGFMSSMPINFSLYEACFYLLSTVNRPISNKDVTQMFNLDKKRSARIFMELMKRYKYKASRPQIGRQSVTVIDPVHGSSSSSSSSSSLLSTEMGSGGTRDLVNTVRDQRIHVITDELKAVGDTRGMSYRDLLDKVIDFEERNGARFKLDRKSFDRLIDEMSAKGSVKKVVFNFANGSDVPLKLILLTGNGSSSSSASSIAARGQRVSLLLLSMGVETSDLTDDIDDVRFRSLLIAEQMLTERRARMAKVEEKKAKKKMRADDRIEKKKKKNENDDETMGLANVKKKKKKKDDDDDDGAEESKHEKKKKKKKDKATKQADDDVHEKGDEFKNPQIKELALMSHILSTLTTHVSLFTSSSSFAEIVRGSSKKPFMESPGDMLLTLNAASGGKTIDDDDMSPWSIDLYDAKSTRNRSSIRGYSVSISSSKSSIGNYSSFRMPAMGSSSMKPIKTMFKSPLTLAEFISRFHVITVQSMRAEYGMMSYSSDKKKKKKKKKKDEGDDDFDLHNDDDDEGEEHEEGKCRSISAYAWTSISDLSLHYLASESFNSSDLAISCLVQSLLSESYGISTSDACTCISRRLGRSSSKGLEFAEAVRELCQSRLVSNKVREEEEELEDDGEGRQARFADEKSPGFQLLPEFYLKLQRIPFQELSMDVHSSSNHEFHQLNHAVFSSLLFPRSTNTTDSHWSKLKSKLSSSHKATIPCLPICSLFSIMALVASSSSSSSSCKIGCLDARIIPSTRKETADDWSDVIRLMDGSTNVTFVELNREKEESWIMADDRLHTPYLDDLLKSFILTVEMHPGIDMNQITSLYHHYASPTCVNQLLSLLCASNWIKLVNIGRKFHHSCFVGNISCIEF